MSAEQVLNAQHVLELEDDYFLANDAAAALEEAGATISGPWSNERAAIEGANDQPLTAALLDVNMGTGASFELARLLKQRHVPFAFLTGYDRSIIPSDLRDADILQKPIDPQEIVASIAKMTLHRTEH